jgi:adenine-specific DNA-methyltransferase
LFDDAATLDLKLQDYIYNDWENKFDAIICNPPYMKFHDYDNKGMLCEIETRLGYCLSGLSNLYVLFLLKSIYQLSTNGFLAYIVPSEFLNSGYGIKIKNILLEKKILRHIAIIDFTQSVFHDVITTATILLCAKDDHYEHVKFFIFNNFDDFETLKDGICKYPVNTDTNGNVSFENIRPDVKWRKYYQNENGIRYNNLVSFSTFAKAKRGIATGSNDYFTFNKSKQRRYSIPDASLLPCVCKSVDISSTFFTNDTFEELINSDKKILLFDAELSFDNEFVKQYLNIGELAKIHQLHLTSKRSPWYSLERRKVAPIWASVFNRNGIKFVRNETNALTLTTFHCIYPNSLFINIDLLFAYFLTDVAKQIFDDSRREYGNGLKKFEPNDLNNSQILDLSMIDKSTEETILALLQEYKSDKMKLGNITKINDIFTKIFQIAD